MPFDAFTTAHDLGRLQHIAGVLVRHGLGDLVRRLGWARVLEKAGRAVHASSTATLAQLEPPAQLRSALEELGPTFVKLGQVLAGRADLFGPDWIAEFEKLHSQAPAADPLALRAQLTEDLGAAPEAVFADFDPEPLAAASIAEVHAARLHDGTEVVVKIRRPGIARTIAADLRLLERLASLAEREWPDLRPYQPVSLVRQLARSLRRELDLASECHNAERIAANFANRPTLVVPKVYWAWTHERVNVQTRIRGIEGHRYDALEPAGLDRHLLAQRGAMAVLQMVIEDGFFHADPHPGNVFYLPGNRLALIDFGMVGRLTPERRDQLLRLLLGLVQRKSDAVCDVLTAWIRDGEDADLDLLQDDITAFVDQYRGTPLARLSLAGMLRDITSLLRTHQLALPPDLALLIKTFITLEGLGRKLDPEFEMAAQAQPLLERAMRRRFLPKAMAERGWHSLHQVVNLLSQLPGDTMRLLRAARRGRLHIHIDVHHLERVVDQLDRAASRVTIGMVVASLVIGSSIVMNVSGGPTLLGLPAFGLLGFLGAVTGAIWLLWSILRSGHGERDAEHHG